MMLAMVLLYIIFITLRYNPFMPSFIRAVIMKGCWILLMVFSAPIEIIVCFFVFAYVNRLYYN
jgi:hypothetical protein